LEHIILSKLGIVCENFIHLCHQVKKGHCFEFYISKAKKKKRSANYSMPIFIQSFLKQNAMEVMRLLQSFSQGWN